MSEGGSASCSASISDCANESLALSSSPALTPVLTIPREADAAPFHSLFAFDRDLILGSNGLQSCSSGMWQNLYAPTGGQPIPNPPCLYDPDNIQHANGCYDCRCLNYFWGSAGNPVPVDLSYDRLAWCNLPVRRPPSLNSPTPGIHYQSDYHDYAVNLRGLDGTNPSVSVQRRFVVDTFYQSRAEPLRSILLAVHAGLRMREAFRTASDQAIIMGFTGDIISWEKHKGMTSGATYATPATFPPWEFDAETARLLQVSNFNFSGLKWANRIEHVAYPVVIPNFLASGMFPRRSYQSQSHTPRGSNLGMAILQAVNALADPTQCAVDANKNIVLFSDGLVNCSINFTVSPGGIVSPSTSCATPEGAYSELLNYNQATQRLVGNDFVSYLLEQKIALSAVLFSPGGQPNLKNVFSGGQYLTHDQVLATGGDDIYLKDIAIGDSTAFEDWKDQCETTFCSGGACARCSETVYAFSKQNIPGVMFRAAPAFWAELSHATNGEACLIRPLCHEIDEAAGLGLTADDVYEDDDSNPSTPRRIMNDLRATPPYSVASGGKTYLVCSEFEQTRAEQAVACVMNALGFAPYQSVTSS